MVVRVGLTCALLLTFACGESRRDGAGTGATGGSGGSAGLAPQSAGAGTGGGTGGAKAGTGGSGTSSGGAGGEAGRSGPGVSGGNAGMFAGTGGGGMAALAVGGAAQAASGGGGVSGADEAGAAGDGGHAGQPDVPDHDDFIVRSNEMAEYEGLTVYATFDHNIEPISRSEPRSDTISRGSFELHWAQAFNRISFGASVVLFVDRQGDGSCTEEVDPAWSAFANNRANAGNPEVFEFDPALVPEGALITCEEFDSWFGESFPGT